MSEEVIEQEEVQLTEEEIRAKTQGWTPKDQWKGNPDDWRDAKTFLDKGDKIQGILKERNRKMEAELREVRELLYEMRDSNKKAQLQGYQKAIEEITKRQRQAAEEADVDAFDAAEAEKQRLNQEYQTANQQQPQQFKPDPEAAQWAEDNPWFHEDEDMRAYALGICSQIEAEGYSGRELFDEVGKRTKKVFAHKLTNPRREQPGAVEHDTPPPAKKSGRAFADLPEGARATYQRLKKQFAMSGHDYTKEEYVANYIWED